MGLKFNGQEVSAKVYKSKIEDNMPRGKNKRVTFVLCNARPYMRLSEMGPSNVIGGEYSLPMFDTVTLDLGDGNGPTEGLLQYYKSAQKKAFPNGVISEVMEPYYNHFLKHVIHVDPVKNPTLFFFMLVHSENEDNTGKTGKPPVFRMVRPSEANKKSVVDIDLKIEALTKLKEIKNSNKKQLRAFYEATGTRQAPHNDWDEKVGIEIKDKEWDDILAPLYAMCESDPKKALELMNDAALDIAAKVQNAIEKGVIKADGNSIFWGDHIKTDLKKRKIANIPKGKGDVWQEWFANTFLRSEVELVEELNTELAASK